METPRSTTKQVERLHSLAAHWEKELDVILEEQALGRNIDFTIAQIRNTYQDIIFLDFEYAVNQGIENKIWTKHHRIIERYRRNIHKLRETAGKKKPVELRKMVTNFVNFIKATTKFYRGFIQRLASHFGVCELEPVVEQFKLTISEPDEPISASPEIRRLSIRSCHRCLVILGDLSRYRELASLTEKNWAPATGYYDLAKKLVPKSGSPHNQLAVISASDGSNLSATYHLYRAVSVKEPFPESGNNLGLGFQKILKAYRSGKLGSNLVRKEEQQVSELLSLFTRLHAKYFNGKEAFELHESLQAEMLAQLTQDLKERLLSEGMLNKLVLINIAAEAYAAIRRTGREALQAVNNFLNLNVQTFNTLLLVFQPELERASVNRDKPTNPTEYVSAVGRRMLPALRLYSKWLLVSHEKLHNTLDDTALAVQTKQLWQTYANTLSLLAATFNVDTLPRLEYMLEEDEDIIGFLPLSGALKVGENGEDIAEGSLLKHEKDAPYRVHPNEEQLSRVLLLLEDGLTLCGNPSVPIAVVDGTIIYQEDGMNTSILPSASPAGLDALSRPAGTDQVFTDMPSEMLPVPPQVERPVSLMVGHGGGSVGGSVAPSESASVMVAMNRMVDSIVGPRGGGETVSEEDEDDLREEEERTRHLERGKKQHDKESPIEEEEILFVGRKSRGGGISKGFTSTVTVGKAGPGPHMGKKDITNTIVSTRVTPPMGQRFTTAISASTRKPDLRGMGPSINSSGHVEYTHPINPPESRFETQLPEPSTLIPSSNPPSQVAPIGVTAAAITTNNSTPIQSTPPSITPAIPYQSSVPTGMGTYTASDLVKQLHSYSSQMNIASVSVTPSRSPQQSSTAHIQHPYTPQLPSPIGVKGHGGVGMGGDLWWSPGGGQPPPGVSNGGVYTEGETSLFMYGTGTGNNGGWGNTQGQSQGVGAGGGTGSPPLGYR